MSCENSCKCHCHSDEDDIPPGHLSTCLFADPDYVPPGFREFVQAATEHIEDGFDHGFSKYLRENGRGSS